MSKGKAATAAIAVVLGFVGAITLCVYGLSNIPADWASQHGGELVTGFFVLIGILACVVAVIGLYKGFRNLPE